MLHSPSSIIKISFIRFALALSLPALMMTSGFARENPGRIPSNRIDIGPRFSFNISTEFKNIGGFPAQTDIGPESAGAEHFYDDGFNRVDASGNAGGETSFWGYQNPNQVAGESLLMSSSQSHGEASRSVRDDPQTGLEITYTRQVWREREYLLGWEVGLGWDDLSFGDRKATVSNITRTTDAYALNGMQPPPPPYSGPFSRPVGGGSPLLSDQPDRSQETITGGATTTGRRNLDVNLYGFRTGPYIDVPLSTRFSLQLSVGVAMAFVDSDFSFAETTTIPGVGAAERNASGSESKLLFGGYGDARLIAYLTRNVNLFTGLQYQRLGTFTHKLEGREARVDFGNSLFVSAGVGFSF